MQLILLLALLLSRGGSNDFYKELKPILESLGGDDIKNVLKGAEEFKDMFASFGGASAGCNGTQCGCGQKDGTYAANNANAGKCGDTCVADDSKHAAPCGDGEECVPPFAMAPVVHIADREIVYRLAQYFSEGAPGA